MKPRMWKIGELAEATGLTVRALHHYHTIGLLVPSRRAASGYRLYDEGVVKRLYAIVALRELGLSLAEIRSTLSGVIDLESVMKRHVEHLDRRIALSRSLREKVARSISAMGNGGGSVNDLLEIMEAMAMFEKYYTSEQLDNLSKRRASLGEEGMRLAEHAWAELIAETEAARQSGTDPSDPHVQAMGEN